MSERDQAAKPAPTTAREQPAPPTSSTQEPRNTHGADQVLERRQDEREQKIVLLDQAKDFALNSFKIIAEGADAAIAAIHVPELPKTDLTKELIGFAAAGLFAASGGALAGWVAASFGAAVAEKASKLASDLMAAAVKRALERPSIAAAKSLQDLRAAFAETIAVQQLAAERRFIGRWPAVRAALDLLPAQQLATLNELASQAETGTVYAEAKRQAFVAWTNFVARAKHGAMGPWDHWAEGGGRNAIALPGAAAAPKSGALDPTSNNVAPNNNSDYLANIQRPMQDDPFGLLEIFVFGSDAKTLRIVDRPGYRMRLDNVGPKVREEFRSMGRVRDLRVNKVVHVCSHFTQNVRVDPPASIASVLITADGHVRAHNWAVFEKMHFEPRKGPFWDPTGFGACMDELIQDQESAGCRIDHKAKRREMFELASAAQELPLTYLEA